ncbi:hypothetical protein EYF80_055119 [Liparis tanakae]|uniref:Uncharacterized protein n=1 Tax=Liparis tanakae TaxID=230148 RepID=A0A4Z2F0Q1_9TELE|nr:hypothetical protein EYF80_055119 [Liparis tanakae]
MMGNRGMIGKQRDDGKQRDCDGRLLGLVRAELSSPPAEERRALGCLEAAGGGEKEGVWRDGSEGEEEEKEEEEREEEEALKGVKVAKASRPSAGEKSPWRL